MTPTKCLENPYIFPPRMSFSSSTTTTPDRSRLWCTFELGAFLRDECEAKPIQFIPVSLSLFLLAQSVLISSLWSLSLIMSDLGDRASIVSESTRLKVWLPVVLAFMLPVGLIIQPIMLHCGLRHMQELLALRDRMANYSIRACECTCCSVDHCDPATGSVRIVVGQNFTGLCIPELSIDGT